MASRTIVVPEPVDDTTDGLELRVTRHGGVTTVTLDYVAAGQPHRKVWVGAQIPTTARTPTRNAVAALLADAKAEWGFG